MTTARIIARIRKLQSAENSSGWDLADAYAELQAAGWTVRRIAEECQSDKSTVGRLCQMSQFWDNPSDRPSFISASQTIIRLSREREAAQRARIRAAEVEGYGIADEVRLGDFREVLADVPDGGVDLIFTDPPFARESLELFADLGEFAARVLTDGGSLVTYFGQPLLPEVLDRLRLAGLTYRWNPTVAHECGMARMHMPKVAVHCKPLLWLSKGQSLYQAGFLRDLLKSTRPAKRVHDWEQSEDEAGYVIEMLSPPGGLVIDPMAGSGTTLAAAARLGRRYLGAEIDERNCRQASKRLAGIRDAIAT